MLSEHFHLLSDRSKSFLVEHRLLDGARAGAKDVRACCRHFDPHIEKRMKNGKDFELLLKDFAAPKMLIGATGANRDVKGRIEEKKKANEEERKKKLKEKEAEEELARENETRRSARGGLKSSGLLPKSSALEFSRMDFTRRGTRISSQSTCESFVSSSIFKFKIEKIKKFFKFFFRSGSSFLAPFRHPRR